MPSRASSPIRYDKERARAIGRHERENDSRFHHQHDDLWNAGVALHRRGSGLQRTEQNPGPDHAGGIQARE